MKLIIDIPEDMCDWLLDGFPDDEDNIRLYEAVKAGIPIKEDEGRVIDGVNLDRVIERFTNLLELQRGFFVEVIGAEFTEHELKEIIYLLGELKAYNEHTRTHASDSSEHETHEERTEGDCISREAAIQAVTHFDDSLKRLYELPSVNQWIPTSERLPQHFNEVLLSFETMFRTIVTIGHLVKSRDGLMWSIVEYYFPFDINDVKAWMELPEPYEEGNDDK